MGWPDWLGPPGARRSPWGRSGLGERNLRTSPSPYKCTCAGQLASWLPRATVSPYCGGRIREHTQREPCASCGPSISLVLGASPVRRDATPSQGRGGDSVSPSVCVKPWALSLHLQPCPPPALGSACWDACVLQIPTVKMDNHFVTRQAPPKPQTSQLPGALPLYPSQHLTSGAAPTPCPRDPARASACPSLLPVSAGVTSTHSFLSYILNTTRSVLLGDRSEVCAHPPPRERRQRASLGFRSGRSRSRTPAGRRRAPR